ncbi:22222_t:CDS:2, partial [Racocetra persica]
ALRNEFTDHKVYLSEIHKATTKYYSGKRKNMLNDAASLYEELSADSYQWVLHQTKQATGGYIPAVIMTDADPALDLAISEEYEQSYTMHCIFHISQNLHQNLEAKQIPLILSAAILPQTLFPELDKALSQFILSEIQKIQHAKIKSCLNYHASAITKDEMIKYQEEEPYYVATCCSKNFSQDQPTEFTRSNINRLFIPADLWDERKENINEQKLYGELWGVAQNITQKAVQLYRQDVLEKLQNLLTKMQDEELVNSPANDDNEEIYSNSLDDNEEYEETNSLSDIPLQNPKKRKAKGRPKSSKRIKRSEELKLAKRQNQCENCS